MNIPAFPDSGDTVPDGDIERWKEGGRRFREFYETLTEDERRSICILSPAKRPQVPEKDWVYPGNLIGLFLGEKAATTVYSFNFLPSVFQRIQSCGFSVKDNFIYDRAKVEETMREHPEVFEKFPDDADECMTRISSLWSKNNSQEIVVAAGYLFGYPESAVRYFSKEPHIGKVGYGSNLFGWADAKNSQESIERELQLDRAFEASGTETIGQEFNVAGLKIPVQRKIRDLLSKK